MDKEALVHKIIDNYAPVFPGVRVRACCGETITVLDVRGPENNGVALCIKCRGKFYTDGTPTKTIVGISVGLL